MKKLICRMSWVFVIFMMFFTTSYQNTLVISDSNKKTAPGQMKKATDGQSAKAYAPGQKKKKH